MKAACVVRIITEGIRSFAPANPACPIIGNEIKNRKQVHNLVQCCDVCELSLRKRKQVLVIKQGDEWLGLETSAWNLSAQRKAVYCLFCT